MANYKNMDVASCAGTAVIGKVGIASANMDVAGCLPDMSSGTAVVGKTGIARQRDEIAARAAAIKPPVGP